MTGGLLPKGFDTIIPIEQIILLLMKQFQDEASSVFCQKYLSLVYTPLAAYESIALLLMLALFPLLPFDS